MSPEQLYAHLREQQPLLLDVREPWEFELCHIEGSINMPMGQIPGRLDELGQYEEIVVICHHGVRSRNVIQYLQHHGQRGLVNLDGGVDAWARQVDPAMAVY